MMVADLMKTFPNRALFNLDEISDTAEEPFGDVLKELTKIVKKSTGDEASRQLISLTVDEAFAASFFVSHDPFSSFSNAS